MTKRRSSEPVDSVPVADGSPGMSGNPEDDAGSDPDAGTSDRGDIERARSEAVRAGGDRAARIVAESLDDEAKLFKLIEDVVLGAGRRFTAEEVRQRTGVDRDLARAMWVAMGFPLVPDDEAAYTEADVEALQETGHLLSIGVLDRAAQVRLARVTSQAMATVAAAHIDVLSPDDRIATVDGLLWLVRYGDDALPVLDRLFGYLYRRHLVAAAQRAAIVASPADAGSVPVAVGFADLSGFTRAARAASKEELTGIVDDFLSAAADVVATGGGRVVKLIGDEVMFTVRSPAAAAEIALGLVETGDRGETWLPVHAGVAIGPVLNHQGDVFGSTVNLASRLADASRAGRVLVNEELAAALQGNDRYRVRRSRVRSLKHVGHVRAYTLTRAAAGGPGGDEGG